MSKAASCAGRGAAVALMLAGVGTDAHQFIPPAGYSGDATRPGVATPTEPGAPALTRIPNTELAGLFRVDPTYRRAAAARAEVVGAFAVAEPAGTHLVAAWAPGFLPVTLSFSDGRCFSLAADYVGGTLSGGRLIRTECDGQRSADLPRSRPPSGRALRLVDSAWGYGAWVDDQAGTTIVTAPSTIFEPLFTARMAASAMAAMNGPDWPGGNVTLVGRINGRLVVVTLAVAY